ncbi:MAG: tetratricopeptide repeat protein [Planctomycetes bacterium]|nr:tetratricopeptide repeat protein [Planctomycetota bacterium]MCB9905495.1 tetratricopeptide repeat protein [Planctomycetota bacterium]
MSVITESAPKAPKRERKASKAGRWRALALLAVHVAIALHVAHWWATGSTVSPLEPSEGMEFSKRGVVNAGLIFFLVMIVTTAITGRFFCGWACHLIAVQDACTWLLKKLRIRPKPFRSKALMAVPMIAFVYMFLYPVFARLVLLGEHQHVEAWQLSQELTTEGFWDTFPAWPIAVLTLLIGGFGIVYFLGNKGFCTYMCPYGAIFGVVDRLAPFRIRVSNACEGCGHCTAACTSNVMVHAEVRDYGTVVDAGCMRCLDCVSVCPNDALSLSFGAPALWPKLRTDRRADAPKTPIKRWRPLRYSDYSLGEEALITAFYVAFFLTFRGLYTQIPFLFALAIAGIMAFLAIETVRLFRRSTHSLQSISLKRGGKLTGRGKAYVATMGLLLAFTAHSAVVRWNERTRDDAWNATGQVRYEFGQGAVRELTPEERRTAEDLRDSAGRVDHIALVSNWRNSERLAWGALLLGDSARYEQEMRLALKQSGGRASVHADYGQWLAAQGRAREAEAHLRLALEDQPGDELASRVLGLELARADRLAEAEGVFSDALGHHPDVALLWYGLASIRNLAGRPADAVPAFEAAVQLSPGYTEAWVDLAQTRYNLGQTDRSLADFRVAADQVPEHVELRIRVAWAALQAGRAPEARAFFEEASALAPSRPELADELQRLEAALLALEAAR